MQRYVLGPHVRACVSDDGAVLMDLEQGTYIGFDPDQVRLICSLVDGLTADVSSVEPSAAARALVKSLDERGLVAEADIAIQSQPLSFPERAPTSVRTPHSELVAWDETLERRIRISNVVAFVGALSTAFVLMRFCSFWRIVRRVTTRRGTAESAGTTFDCSRARELISAYVHIRLFVFAPKARCLLDSLTMLEYLASYGLYPDWVIGVQINPFASHSWLQYDGFVLNGTPHYVRAYMPILVT